MNCTQTKEYIFDLILGESLPDETRSEVEIHLASCGGCRRLEEELGSVWRSVGRPERIRFPRRFTRRALRRLAAEEKFSRFSGRWWVCFPERAYLGAGAAVALASIIFFVLARPDWSGRGGEVSHLASVFQKECPELPDLTTTLGTYLEQASGLLFGLRAGDYPTWKDMFQEIFRVDIQGRSRYLLDSLEARSPARPLVQNLHDAFWKILQAGRGRESEKISLPPAVDPRALLNQIEEYQSLHPKGQ